MYDVLKGIRVVDMSMYAFGPMCGAVLSDWGADVVKVMNPLYMDPLLVSSSAVPLPAPKVAASFVWETVNRGKRSIGLDTGKAEGKRVLHELIAAADVFLTNMLPDARRKVGIDLDQVRAINPQIIYARASGFGPRGDEAGKPGFDHTAFWARSGIGHANSQISAEFLPQLSPAFGDVLSGMALAGGVAAALLKRERGAGTSVVDASLLAMGLYAYAPNIAASSIHDIDVVPRVAHSEGIYALVTSYRTKDGRYVLFAGGQTDASWKNFFEAIGRPELMRDARFADKASREKNARALIRLLDDVFAARSYAEWQPRLANVETPWCLVQNAREAAADPQARANEYVVAVETPKGEPFKLVLSPVQFDERGTPLRRAPTLGEHTDAVLRELGKSEAEIRELRAGKAVV
jgi:crotonobetainyl-CoA:carnitine CoA-transferase CaiB-like acyl-CoA transferase